MAGEVTHLLALAEGDSPAARWLSCAISGLCRGQGWAEALGAHPAQVARAVRDQHLKHAAQLLGNDATALY